MTPDFISNILVLSITILLESFASDQGYYSLLFTVRSNGTGKIGILPSLMSFMYPVESLVRIQIRNFP
jgi:hypothetical protein